MTNAASLSPPSIAALFSAMTALLLSYSRGATEALTLRPPRRSTTNRGRVAPGPGPRPSTKPATTHLPAGTGSDSAGDTGPIGGAGGSRGGRRVVVVGGGVGGLAVASRIASSSSSSSSAASADGGDSPMLDVVVLEKNPGEDMVGGRCGSFDVNVKVDGVDGTFRHERGPSLLLLREEYERLFRDCGSDAASFGLVMERCVPAYQVVFDDGDFLEVGFPRAVGGSGAGAARGDRDGGGEEERAYARSRAKMDSFEPDGARKWDEYMEACSAFLNCGLPNFIEERLDLPSFPAFLREALRGGGKFWPLKPHSDVLDATFQSEKMRTMASFQDLYVGLEPYRNDGDDGRNPVSLSSFGGGVWRKTAPAVFGLLAALELHPTNPRAGVFAPIGGFRAVGEALHGLAKERGVDVRLGATVTRVCEEGVYYRRGGGDDNGNGGADDESTTEAFLAADLVVVNADVPYATKCLMSSPSSQSPRRKDDGEEGQEDVRYDWEDSFDFSSGVVAFHWSIDRVLDGLNTHNVFLAATSRADAEGSWRVVRGNGEGTKGKPPPGYGLVEPFNFYVHRPSKTDPTAAPPGCDSITVLVPCRALSRDEDFAALPRRESLRRYGEQFDDDVVDGLREAVLSRLAALRGLEGLKSSILHEVVDTPRDYADMYNVGGGVPFGLSHGFGQLSLTRPSAESSGLHNVLFVGASSRPGNGVPLVLIGAKAVAVKALGKMESVATA